jgi:hypothetical protein
MHLFTAQMRAFLTLRVAETSMVESQRKGVQALVLAVTATLAGCAATTEVLQNATTQQSADLFEPDYRRIVSQNIKATFPNLPAGDWEISGVRPVQHLKGPAWLTCVRVDPGGDPHQYAIFIQNNAILEGRVAVAIDQCHKEAYSPLPPPEPEKPPAPTRNVASPRSGKRL